MRAASLGACLFGLLLWPLACEAQSSVVWQIGKFDDSSLEFQSRSTAPVFVVGKSDSVQDWSASQSATREGSPDYAARTSTVKFDLPEAPRGLYTLRLSLLAHTRRLPVIEVEINGRRGRFFQHPVLNFSRGNPATYSTPQYSKAVITFDVATAYLQQSANTLIIRAIEEGDSQGPSGSAAGGASSAITWDALSLEHDPAKAYSSDAVSAEIVPTIFYKKRGNQLIETVDVFLRYNEPPKQGRGTLALGSNVFTLDVATGSAFGEQRLRFEVPEFTSPAAARATIAMNGRVRQFSAEVTAAKKWNLFVVPHQHMDIGYTDYVPKVAEVQSRAIDDSMEVMRQHPDFRYTLDLSWVAEKYLAGRTEAQRNEFFRLIREKKIFLPAFYAGYYTGLPNLEYLLRSLYYSYKLNRENGGDFDHGIITDLPNHTWSIPSIMAAAGLKYLVVAANNTLGPMLLIGRLHEKSPFWWEGPDGQRILTWYSRHYLQVNYLFGLPPQLQAGYDNLPTFLQSYTRPDYRSDGVIVFGTQVENTELHREQASLASDWNEAYAYPKMKFAGVAEALQYIAGQMGDSIPVIRGDGSPYWDVFAPSQPYYQALMRETEHRVLAAEKFSTISSLVDPRTRPDPLAMETLWREMLAFEEHTWGGGRSGTLRARHTKDALADDSTRLVEDVLARSMSTLAASIPDPSGTLIVFNPLNWQRSGLVAFNLARDRELVDKATGRVVEVEELPQPAGAAPAGGRGAGARRVRFLAAAVPPVGYKCYTIQQASAAVPAPASAANPVMENAYYRVVLDPATGAISSVFDKELSRELVDASSPYRFNQLVSATGTQSTYNRGGLSIAVAPPPDLEIHTAAGGKLVSVTKTSFGTVARLEASALNNPRIAVEIVLFDSQKKIEITNRIQKERASTGEWGYFAFPFAMQRPVFRYEIQNGVVNPATDVLPGGGREWSPVQHWVTTSQDDVTAALVPIDAPLVTFGDIVRWRWPDEFGTRKSTVFSFAFNHPPVGPELTFRYVVTSGRRLPQGSLSRLGWEAMSPFELNEIVSQDKVGNPPRPLGPAQGSFVQVDHPSVVLVTWKRSENEEGTIMRFVETNGQPGTVRVSSPILNLTRAWLCNGVEENQRPLTVSDRGFSFDVKPFEIVTVRLREN
jgi:alpha-mannosidase